MKTLIFIVLVLMLGVCGQVLAETTTVVTEEYGAPITVERDTYTLSPPSYYYYSGHRCYTKERNDISVNFLGLRAGVGGSGEKIYCYPYP